LKDIEPGYQTPQKLQIQRIKPIIQPAVTDVI